MTYNFLDLPEIFTSEGELQTSIPTNFKVITLNAQIDSDLSWKGAKEEAQQAIADGFMLLWKLDFGFFDLLTHSLHDQMQFGAFLLASQHFKETLWTEFHAHTIAVALYEGSVNFFDHFRWREEYAEELQNWMKDFFINVDSFVLETTLDISSFNEITWTSLYSQEKGRFLLSLFCRDMCLNYIKQLAKSLPGDLTSTMILDNEIDDPILASYLLNKSHYDPLCRILKSEKMMTEQPSIGICLSSPLPTAKLRFEMAMKKGGHMPSALRYILEENLTSEWDGLDTLIVDAKTLSPLGIRKLRGFCAAGGEVITID